MAGIPVLETDRLRLQPFSQDDAPMVQQLCGDFEIADTTSKIPHPYVDGLAEKWITGHEKSFSQGDGLSLAVVLRSEHRLVGAISLMDIQQGHQAEMGYWVGVPFWGNGYCTEVAAAIIDYSFRSLGLVRLHARLLTRNPASARVLQKLGFLHEGTRRGHAMKWGKLEDLELYGLNKQP